MITVAIIDDNRLVREGLRAMLGRIADMQVVTASGADGEFLERANPDVVLLDVGLRDEESLRVAASVCREAPNARIIAMDVMAVSEDIMEFVHAGVSGFVLKDATIDELIKTIQAVMRGEKVLPRTMTDSLFSQIVKEAGRFEAEELLEDVRMTPRELQVIELIGEGLSNKEISQRLNIAAHTVKSHVRNVMEKLALHTRLQIAAYSRR
jgi:DNA-binding NarL/FixJ family response regulator